MKTTLAALILALIWLSSASAIQWDNVPETSLQPYDRDERPNLLDVGKPLYRLGEIVTVDNAGQKETANAVIVNYSTDGHQWFYKLRSVRFAPLAPNGTHGKSEANHP